MPTKMIFGVFMVKMISLSTFNWQDNQRFILVRGILCHIHNNPQDAGCVFMIMQPAISL
jgi:hypothetical protein